MFLFTCLKLYYNNGILQGGQIAACVIFVCHSPILLTKTKIYILLLYILFVYFMLALDIIGVIHMAREHNIIHVGHLWYNIIIMYL